jgi:lysophospholipase L1-like esterase
MKRLLFAALLLLPLAAQATTNIAEAPISRMDLPRWNHRFTQTLQQARETPDAKIVWLGDSITYYWQRQGGHGYDDIKPVWDKYYAPYHALEFGFIGDTTASLIWRLDHGQVAGLHPQLVIILIGANNFGRVHWDAAMTIPAVEAVVRNTHQRLPGAHIVLLGVLPSIRSPWVDAQTVATNAALARAYANNKDVTFRDVGYLLMKNGHTDESLYVDQHLNPPDPPLHPNAEGMSRIAAALAPLVRQYVQ